MVAKAAAATTRDTRRGKFGIQIEFKRSLKSPPVDGGSGSGRVGSTDRVEASQSSYFVSPLKITWFALLSLA